MKLSFIVPVYRPKVDVLEKCLVSLREQALKDWEAIVVLDGPCPEARATVKKVFKKCDNPVKVIEIEHGGAPKARNEGAKQAIGDIWVFWDSDCVIEPGASKAWMDLFEKRKEIGFIYSGYKFFGDKVAINSEPWDPYLLRVRNFISTCFPVRRELFDGWTEDLKSLQDWDFWLSVLAKAEKLGYEPSTVGKFLSGFAFATAYPEGDSISAKGCTPDVWLERLDAVKKRHNLPERTVCVVAPAHKMDGVKLAKMIGADYQDNPNDKPNRYKTLVQIGFSAAVSDVERDSAGLAKGDCKKFLFWTGENISQLYNGTSVRAMLMYRTLLNGVTRQLVEDKNAEKQMTDLGFNVEVMPLPIVNEAQVEPMPEKPRWLLDLSGEYMQFFGAVEVSLPDIELEVMQEDHPRPLKDYTGFVSFFTDKSLSNGIKRAHLTARHVVSNVQQPFCGFVDDTKGPEKFIVEVVDKIRAASEKEPHLIARSYYEKSLSPEKFLEAIAC